jgi:Domain of unknown function (DUF4484)/DENN domain-containing protein 11
MGTFKWVELTFKVYDLSIFATTPLSLANSLVLPSESMVRLGPLFAIGIHDIPMLEKLSSPQSSQPTSSANSHLEREEGQQEDQLGWVACTTDEIIAMKTKLYDIVVEFPASHLAQENKKRYYPIIKSAVDGKQIKSTQRDYRRFKLLSRALWPLREQGSPGSQHSAAQDENEPLIQATPGAYEEEINDDGDVVESSRWSELAYHSFIWWASAGEKDEGHVEEEKLDSSCIGDLADVAEQIADERRYRDEESNDDPESTLVQSSSNADDEPWKDARIQMAIISYFHRLTRNIFEVCSDVAQAVEAEDHEGYIHHIDREELRTMGLDVWSASDKEFVRCFFELWFQKRVHVNPLGVECCGIKIC